METESHLEHTADVHQPAPRDLLEETEEVREAECRRQVEEMSPDTRALYLLAVSSYSGNYVVFKGGQLVGHFSDTTQLIQFLGNGHKRDKEG